MSAPRRRVILIGIGGSSASGKSTLAQGLAEELNSPLKGFSADHYLDIKRVRQAGSWETPAGIAWDDLRAALEKTVSTLAQCERLPASLVVGGFSRGPLELVPAGQGGKLLGSEPVVVIIEGFLLFSDKKLCDMLDIALWIETICDICAQRRYNREGRRGTFVNYMEGFRREVWHHYELYRGEQLANVPKVQCLDGALEPSSILTQALMHCRENDVSVALEDAAPSKDDTLAKDAEERTLRRVVLIGIGGSSASGKSTLTDGLVKELDSPLKGFSADHYLDFSRVRKVGSWETPEGIAWDDLRAALQDVKDKLARSENLPRSLVVGGFSRGALELVPNGHGGKPLGSEPVVVFVEGFLLFSDKKLCDMLDLALWIDSDCETCARRRHAREGGRGSSATYLQNFQSEVWSHYERYSGQQLANVPKVHHLDGNLDPEKLIVQAADQCKAVLDCSSREAKAVPKDEKDARHSSDVAEPHRQCVQH